MNQSTRDIAALLRISLKDAVKIQDYIDNKALLDWSECTTAQFQRAVLIASTALTAKLIAEA